MTHYLKPNHENRVPSYHVVVDTETFPRVDSAVPGESRHMLMMGCARAWRYRAGKVGGICDHEFVSRKGFWDWLYARLVKGTRVWVWAHNQAFDSTVLGLWNEVQDGRLAFKQPPTRPRDPSRPEGSEEVCGPSLITSPFAFLADCITPDGHSIRFIDSANFCPISVEKIGPMIGLDKLPMPGEIADDLDWLAYCKRDVEILYRLVDRLCGWVRRHDLGNMAVTLGGQAMAHYRHRHMDDRIAVGPDAEIRPLERDGYYGARTQAYYRGISLESGTESFPLLAVAARGKPCICNDGITRIDCNGCYPHVMRSGRFPCRLYRRYYSPSVAELAAVLVHQCGIAAVRLFSPYEPWPVRVKGRTVWRVGKVHTVLAGPELDRAIRSGVVDAVDYAQTYLTGNIFAAWADEVEAGRAEADLRGDGLESALWKRMANSLHGKFGQRATGWETVPNEVPPIPWGEYTERVAGEPTIRQCRAVGNLKQVYVREDDGEGSNPAIAAFVTSYAREHIRACRLAAGPQQVVYEDADSLHVLPEGMERLQSQGWIHASTPGKFKVEAVAYSAEYRGPKHYRFGDAEVIPGHALSGRYDARGTWSQTEWIGLDQLLSTGMPEAPITVERGLNPVAVDDGEMYTDAGWWTPRQGG